VGVFFKALTLYPSIFRIEWNEKNIHERCLKTPNSKASEFGMIFGSTDAFDNQNRTVFILFSVETF
jgi:hypothetical protein